MNKKLLFTTGIPAKKRMRINGHGAYSIEVDVKLPKDVTKALITSSEYLKQNKIMAYPDIIKSGKNKITIINLSPYPVDLEEKDHIVTCVPVSSRCNCDCKK
jgi:hypothetical protein